MENMHTDVRLYSVPGSLSCTFRKATSVKKEESSKAKKNRRPISLDSGREMMCTYWGCPILFMWRVIERFYFHGNHDFNFFLDLFIIKTWSSWISCEHRRIMNIYHDAWKGLLFLCDWVLQKGLGDSPYWWSGRAG